MMYRFEQVDVFTHQRFAGNPLAVFTEATGLTSAQMQLIAREMNLSETTFVVPSDNPECVARYHIYTPGRELPFAGHPTLGTAYVLARAGRVAPSATSFNLEAKAGVIPIRVEGDVASPRGLFFSTPEIVFDARYENRDPIAEALNVRGEDLLPGAPLEQIGCPVLHLTVGLRTPAAVDRVVLNSPLLLRLLGKEESDGVYLFAPGGEPNRFYCRLLCFENVGVVEDPATGSAAGPLGAYLVRYGLASGGAVVAIEIDQGVKMGRPSVLHVRVHRDGPAAQRVEVGGSVVPVLTGELEI
jgi:trans-2,3-dihydro-3-hydroxyanthranilate isomerase